jgi:hypothetical protein
MSDYPECPHNMSSYLLDTTLETLGLSVAEGKAMLHGVQDFVADGIPFEHKPDSTEEDGEL